MFAGFLARIFYKFEKFARDNRRSEAEMKEHLKQHQLNLKSFEELKSDKISGRSKPPAWACVRYL